MLSIFNFDSYQSNKTPDFHNIKTTDFLKYGYGEKFVELQGKIFQDQFFIYVLEIHRHQRSTWLHHC